MKLPAVGFAAIFSQSTVFGVSLSIYDPKVRLVFHRGFPRKTPDGKYIDMLVIYA